LENSLEFNCYLYGAIWFLLNCFVSGIYGAMAVAGSFICSITGIDSLGGFHLSLDAIVQGLGYAVPPIMALLFILDVSSFVYSLYYSI